MPTQSEPNSLFANLPSLDQLDFEGFLQDTGEWVIVHGLKILLILILMLLFTKMAKVVSTRLFHAYKRKDDEEFRKRLDTLSATTGNLLSIVIIIIAFVMILGEFGISLGPILASAGIVGIAVGFGAQHLVSDIISGFFILLDDEIRVGDWIEVTGKSGQVERVNLRLTVLRDLSGNVHYIRNGQIDIVTNMTKDYSRYVFDIGVAYREDVDEVIEVIKEVDQGMREDPTYRRDILEPIEILGLDEFGDSAIIIKARTKTRPLRQWVVAREFNRRLKKTFDARDIEIPFPHVTLYMGQDKDGSAPAMNVKKLNS